MKTLRTSIVLLAPFALAVAGCAQNPAVENATSNIAGSDVAALQQQASELTTENARLEAEVARLMAQRDNAASNSASNTTAGNEIADMFPPNPQPVHCYAKVAVRARFDQVTEQIRQPDAEKIEIIPARFQPGTERVIIKEASKRLEAVPAVYETVTEKVLVKPAVTRKVRVPAVYKTVTEKILDKAAHTAWKPGPAATQQGNVLEVAGGDTGEIMCLVEVPATYKTVKRQIVVTPATTKVETTPAVYKTVTKRVVKTPATTREIVIPAEYKTVNVTKKIQSASERRVTVPGTMQAITTEKKVADERVEWRNILCEVNMTKDNVSKLQQALQKTGYYKGSIDGVMGANTLSASSRYAHARDLPYGTNFITTEVINSLGLKM